MAEIGIPNCGNTCFMNASFQMLYSMKDFRDKIMTTDWNKYSEGNVEGLEKVKALKEIFELMKDVTNWGIQIGNNTLDSYNKETPRWKLIEAKTELIQIISKVGGGRVENLGDQHDASDFINSLLDKIYSFEELSDNVGLLSNLYRGVETIDTYCKMKGSTDIVNNDPKEQPFNLITLPFNNKINITEAMKEREKEEQISPNEVPGKKFKKCDDLSKATKQEYNSYQKTSLTIPEKNKYVIITLKRFEYDKNELTMKRVDSSGFNVEPKVKIDGKNFSLIGAVLHGGDTIDTGHYIYQTYKKDGNVLKTYDDEYMGNEVYGGDNMTLNLNSYVLLYRNDGDVSPTEAAAPSSVAEAPTEAEESTSTPEEAASTSTVAAEASPEAPQSSAASSPEEAATAPVAAASPTEPIAQQKGKGKIERVVLNDGDGYWIYEGFKLVKPEWVPNPKSSGGNKKSRKPKDKKIRLRKTRRRKH